MVYSWLIDKGGHEQDTIAKVFLPNRVVKSSAVVNLHGNFCSDAITNLVHDSVPLME